MDITGMHVNLTLLNYSIYNEQPILSPQKVINHFHALKLHHQLLFVLILAWGGTKMLNKQQPVMVRYELCGTCSLILPGRTFELGYYQSSMSQKNDEHNDKNCNNNRWTMHIFLFRHINEHPPEQSISERAASVFQVKRSSPWCGHSIFTRPKCPFPRGPW